MAEAFLQKRREAIKAALERATAPKPKKVHVPKPVPDGYVCAACGVPGHWVFDCKQYKQKKRCAKKKKAVAPDADSDAGAGSDGEDEDGASKCVPVFREPSADDIARARAAMPVIRQSEAPLCKCGERTRARKNRKEGSPGVGMMFWWCAKDKWDRSNCRFSEKMLTPEERKAGGAQAPSTAEAGGARGAAGKSATATARAAGEVAAGRSSASAAPAVAVVAQSPAPVVATKKRKPSASVDAEDGAEDGAAADEAEAKKRAKKEAKKAEKKEAKRAAKKAAKDAAEA